MSQATRLLALFCGLLFSASSPASGTSVSFGPMVSAESNPSATTMHGRELTLAAGSAAFPGTIEHNGLVRQFTVLRPITVEDSMPMMLVMHGRGGNPEVQANITDLSRSVASGRYWAVLPEYYDATWDDDPSIPRRMDDVGLMNQLINVMKTHFRIDDRRVYATGFSNGGFMAQRLACELSDRLAAVAFVGASITRGLYNSCVPVNPRPVMFVNGTADPIVPWNGRIGLLPVETTIAMWAARLQCDLNPMIEPLNDPAPQDGTTVDLVRYHGCQTGELRLYRVNDGGHTWPGGSQYLPALAVGRTSTDVSASTEIWEFLRRWRQ